MPPMVGVPAFDRWRSGPSGRMLWPIWLRGQPADAARAEEERDQQRGQRRQHGAERDVAEDVEDAEYVVCSGKRSDRASRPAPRGFQPRRHLRHARAVAAHAVLVVGAARALDQDRRRPAASARPPASAALAASAQTWITSTAPPPPRAPAAMASARGPTASSQRTPHGRGVGADAAVQRARSRRRARASRRARRWRARACGRRRRAPPPCWPGWRCRRR